MRAVRRRILMTADAVGGVWQYACSLASGLHAHGYDTLLVVLGPAPDADQRGQVGAIPGLTLLESGLPLDWLAAGPGPVRETAARIADLAASEKVDLVHLNSQVLAAGVRYPAPVLAVAHGCLATWWQAARGERLDPQLAWHRSLAAQGLRECDVAIAPTRAYADMLRSCYRLSRPIEVVHNGRQMANVPKPAPSHDFAFTAGRLWDQVKNTRTLDAVAQRLAFPFHAAGSTIGPNGECIAPEHLNLLGQLAEPALAQWLSARPAFVSAARFEPFGLAVLEAAQAGCPLILSDIPTFRELWDGAAIFVDAEDVTGYVENISACVGDDTLRRHWGTRAQQRAQRYSIEALAHSMARHYGALLERKAAA